MPYEQIILYYALIFLNVFIQIDIERDWNSTIDVSKNVSVHIFSVHSLKSKAYSRGFFHYM